MELSSLPEHPDLPDEAGEVRARTLLAVARETDPEERARAYDFARAVAETDATQARHERLSERYRDELPRFARMWSEHEERWPTPASDSAAPEIALSGVAIDAIARVRAAEPAISADLLRVERDNTCGAWLEAFGCRVKSESRLGEKLSTVAPDATPAEAVRQTPDAIRYTFCVQPEKYTQAYFDITARMEALGYEQYQCKNSWAGAEYKGVNSRWVTASGVRFEVQFHTPDSFHAKHHVTHESYERLRDSRTSRPELRELHTYQQEVSTVLQAPPLAIDIPAFKRKGF